MGKFSRYVYNPETLLYEKKEDSKAIRILKVAGFAFCVAAVVALNFFIYTQVLGRLILRRKTPSGRLSSKYSIITWTLQRKYLET